MIEIMEQPHALEESAADCVPAEERQEIFAEWSCAQYSSFLNLQHVSNINIYVLKTVQTLVFCWLTVSLIRQSRRQADSVGLTPLLVSIILFVNGLGAILIVLATETFFAHPYKKNVFFAVSLFIDESSFFLAIWLFGAMMLETALDIERTVTKQH